jgi:hypothetical protein
VLGLRVCTTAGSSGKLGFTYFRRLAFVRSWYAPTGLRRPPSLVNEPLEAGVCLLDVRPQ